MATTIKTFFDDRTYTLTYVVYDEETRDAVVIDSVLDYDPTGSKLWTESAEQVIDFLVGKELNLHYILETHAHADHLSGAQLLKKRFPDAKLGIGARITEVQRTFKRVFNLPADFPTDGRQFDLLFKDRETITAGSFDVTTHYTPGHTPACVTYQIGDALFTGDAMFMPDQGTGRCDFPAGSAHALYQSINRLYNEFSDDTRIFVGHDYQPGGRELAYETTIGEQKAKNVQLPGDRSEDEFIQFREARDAKLNAPKLLFQSVQVNVDAGKLPEKAAESGKRYLKIPLNAFRPEGSVDDLELIEI